MVREWLVYRTGVLKWKNVCVSRMVPALADSDTICLWVIQLEIFFYIDEYVLCFWCGTPIKGPLSVRFSGVIWFRRGCVANIQTDLVIVIAILWPSGSVFHVRKSWFCNLHGNLLHLVLSFTTGLVQGCSDGVFFRSFVAVLPRRRYFFEFWCFL